MEGDLLLADLGHGLPLRAGAFDGAISISAVQWLCNAVRCVQPLVAAQLGRLPVEPLYCMLQLSPCCCTPRSARKSVTCSCATWRCRTAEGRTLGGACSASSRRCTRASAGALARFCRCLLRGVDAVEALQDHTSTRAWSLRVKQNFVMWFSVWYKLTDATRALGGDGCLCLRIRSEILTASGKLLNAAAMTSAHLHKTPPDRHRLRRRCTRRARGRRR